MSERPEALYVVNHALLTGLQKLPKHDGVAYRGIRVPDYQEALARYALGKDVVWRAFSSASPDPAYAVTGNILFRIQSRTARILGGYADFQPEQEVIFLPESRFRVRGLEPQETRAIIKLEELTPSGEANHGDVR
jgi:hypothetical protein